jgi:hypothetical protein
MTMRMIRRVLTPLRYPSGHPGYRMHMSHHDIDTVLGWRGCTVRDAEGEKIGTFEDVLLDRRTDLPAYARVRTGLFGRRQTIIPLEGAEEVDGDLRIPYAKDHVNAGPNIEPDVAPTAEEEAQLHAHYASPGGGGGAGEADPGDEPPAAGQGHA